MSLKADFYLDFPIIVKPLFYNKANFMTKMVKMNKFKKIVQAFFHSINTMTLIRGRQE